MASLGDICIKTDNIPSSFDGEFEYIDISSVDNIEKKIVSTQHLYSSDAPSRAKQLVYNGDIIISNVRPNLNAVALVDIETKNTLVASTGYTVIRCKENVSNKYVFYFCQYSGFIKSLVNQATGASYPAVNAGIIKNTKIPLPSYDVQLKIAKCLDKLQSVISNRKQQLEKLDELVKARFVEMFGDPVHNTLRLPVEPMTEVCEIIDGDRGKNYPKQEDFFEEEYCLFLNAKNVTKKGFDFLDCMFITKEKDEALRKGKLKRGDIVLTTRGTLGNLAFYTDIVPFENVRINSGMVILRMNREVIDEVFFVEQFRMQVEDIKRTVASGSAQPQLPISTMNKINVVMPDLNAQKSFAKLVSSIDKSKFHEAV